MKKSSEWLEGDLNALVTDQVGEDVSIEYKACASLQKDETNKNEVSRDVSAFANSAGGAIVYGMLEDPRSHLPTGLDSGYDPSVISKDWLENVIHSRIKPKIEGLHINPVQLKGSRAGRVTYVVSIPQSTTAHQASDKKYYKRYNFKREAMEDYEIRDVMNRLKFPLIIPRFWLQPPSKPGAIYAYVLWIALTNRGATTARDLKFQLALPQAFAPIAGAAFSRLETEGEPHFGKDWSLYTLTSSGKAIFPDDEWTISDNSNYRIEFQIDHRRFDRHDSQHPFLHWKTYADDMPKQRGSILLSEIHTVA